MIADDEPLLRKSLARMLAQAWPELEVVAQARNGREAVEMFEAQAAGRLLPRRAHARAVWRGGRALPSAGRAHLVFVTAFDQYAVQAFEQGALDYLVKPVEAARLADTVARLQDRLRQAAASGDAEALVEQLAARSAARAAPPPPLRWLRASVGSTLRLIPVDDGRLPALRREVHADRLARRQGKAGRGAGAHAAEGTAAAARRRPTSSQVHRSVVVNLRAVDHVARGDNETATVHLRHRAETLPVSRSYTHLFKQM